MYDAAASIVSSHIREFRQIRKSLSDEQKESAVELNKFKGARYKSEKAYKEAFENKIFKHGKKYYKYRFKEKIRSRYIGENLNILGILQIADDAPPISELSVNVKNC